MFLCWISAGGGRDCESCRQLPPQVCKIIRWVTSRAVKTVGCTNHRTSATFCTIEMRNPVNYWSCTALGTAYIFFGDSNWGISHLSHWTLKASAALHFFSLLFQDKQWLVCSSLTTWFMVGRNVFATHDTGDKTLQPIYKDTICPLHWLKLN